MTDITVIILTLNEELHIRRCMENVMPWTRDVFVVDCFSNDNTGAIAKEFGASVVQNAWPGSQALQFNWALDHLPIKTKWVLRLDADEYLYPELIDEIKAKLASLPEDVTGVAFKRRHIFLGRWMRRGTYPVTLIRLFRYGKARCEQRLMDEHMELLEGRSIEFEGDFADHNLNDIGWWTAKHNGYALREAADLLDMEYGIFNHEKHEVTRKGERAVSRKGAKAQRGMGKNVTTKDTEGTEKMLWDVESGKWDAGLREEKGREENSGSRQWQSAVGETGGGESGREVAVGSGSRQYRGRKTGLEGQAAEKRAKKMRYARMPLFWRALVYFCYRYFLRGGFLEGREGFLWHFLQGWWYRTLVDAKVWEIRRESGGDPQKMRALLRGKYGMKI